MKVSYLLKDGFILIQVRSQNLNQILWIFSENGSFSITHCLMQVPNHNSHMKSWKAQYHGLLFISGNMHQKKVRNMKYVFFFSSYICVLYFTGGDYQSSLTLFCTFLSFFKRFICKHFVKMYILGKLFLYAIGMLYNALMFKLSVLYFFNGLVVIAQQNVLEVINSN